MLVYLLRIFIMFIIYSFVGWLYECILSFIDYKTYVNRGFLFLPICPIYGFGVLLLKLIYFFKQYNFIEFVIVSSIFCTILEYVTGLILEYIFKARWWDYTNRIFNYKGRVALHISLLFGFASSLVIKYIDPFIYGIILNVNTRFLFIISVILFLAIIIDFIFSCKINLMMKKDLVYYERDNTKEIKDKIKSIL